MDLRPLQPRTVKLAAVFLLLAASLPSFMTMPFAAPWPLDFQNLWTFHDCFARNDPYSASGLDCRDVHLREMRYPPLLYWGFAWTRLLTFEAAGQIMGFLVAVGTVAATVLWLPRPGEGEPADAATGLFTGLLLASYPLVFAIERGNNDVLTLLAWTAAARLWAQGRPGAAGAMAGLDAILKLYPAFACLVVGLGLGAQALRRHQARRTFLAFTAGGVAAVVAGFVVVWPDSVTYFTVTMPRIAKLAPDLFAFGHPLRTLWALGGGWVLALPLLLAWCVAAVLVFERDAELVFAGGLAISTYFAGTSWDYNLITTYPLLVVLFRRSFRPGAGPLPFALLLVGLAGIVGHRGLFHVSTFAMKLHIFLQWAFLVATALAATRLAPPVAAEAPAGQAPTPAAA